MFHHIPIGRYHYYRKRFWCPKDRTFSIQRSQVERHHDITEVFYTVHVLTATLLGWDVVRCIVQVFTRSWPAGSWHGRRAACRGCLKTLPGVLSCLVKSCPYWLLMGVYRKPFSHNKIIQVTKKTMRSIVSQKLQTPLPHIKTFFFPIRDLKILTDFNIKSLEIRSLLGIFLALRNIEFHKKRNITTP
jgi:hypothetical protein